MTGVKGTELWGAVLLLVAGILLLLPKLYESLTQLTAGTPWIQIILGVVSIVVALMLFAGGSRGSSGSEEA
jgi:hypothetical protein